MCLFCSCIIDYNMEIKIKRREKAPDGSSDVHVGRISLGTEELLEETRVEKILYCATSPHDIITVYKL